MELWVLDTSFRSVMIIDNFKSAIWTDRYREYGDFEMCLAMTPDIIQSIRTDYYLYLRESEHAMIIEKLSIESDTEEGNTLIVSGRSLESILQRRIIWGPHSYRGSLQNAVESMLNDAFIAPSISERKVDNFIFEASSDPKVTSLTIDAQYTGSNLYEVIVGLCKENGLGFKIALNDQSQFVFSLYSGKDRSYDQSENPYVVFSPKFENIINSNYFSSNENLKNVTLVAGEGEGASRRTAVIGTTSGLDRRELFTDARDVSSDTETGTLTDAQYIEKLKARGRKNLAEHTGATAFEGEVEATRLFKYGTDFFLGDIVQIANEYGHETSACITELVTSENEEGFSVYPTFQIL